MNDENKDPKTSLEAYLIGHARQDRVLFHMPGHKGGKVFRKTGHGEFLSLMAESDMTEIPGSDNLFDPEGPIALAQERYAAQYGVDRTYLQINGSSGGLIASILAAVPFGGSLIVARNCHKAVFNALRLGNVTPVYARPELLPREGICGAVTAEEIRRLLREHPGVSGAVITSPNYYGIWSDIPAIAKVLHEEGKILIVDQAHGAHQIYFDNYEPNLAGRPRSAEAGGADISVDSIHKTMAGFTQSGILNVQGSLVDTKRLEEMLQTVESSSPSYLLMAGLDINARIMETCGRELIRTWREDLAYFYESAARIRGLECLAGPDVDPTKISFGFPGSGLTGEDLEALLARDYGIDIEICLEDKVMALSGIGNDRADYDSLLRALEDMSERIRQGDLAGRASAAAKDPGAEDATAANTAADPPAFVLGKDGDFVGIPRESEQVPLEEAAGRISAGTVIPYPPGIPLICPGERIGEEHIEYIRRMRETGRSVLGAGDTLSVGKMV